MTRVGEIIEYVSGISVAVQHKILVSLIIIVLLYAIRLVILRIVWKNTDNVKTRYFWKRFVSYTITFIALLLIGMVWIHAFRYMSAFLGLLSAGIAIALKDLLANIAGWFFIIFRKPFVIGDRIQIGQHRGDVIDTRLYQFSILEIGNWINADQSTGRIIHIPNGKVFTEPQANYTQGFNYIWNEIELRITFESNWQKAKSLLENIIARHTSDIIESVEKELKEASKLYLIHYQYLTPIIYVNVVENGVKLTVRYMCYPHQRRGTEARIWEDILQQFEHYSDITWAYPTQRFVNFAGDTTLGKVQE
jgi:small-conductance mechanosensitive channel